MSDRAPIIDLHSHSTASDGHLAPREVAARVAALGAIAWALTDHDTVAGLEEASDAARRADIRFVPGIEFSALHRGLEIHVLGHFIDPSHPELRAFEEEFTAHRHGRVERILGKLKQLGIHLELGEVVACSGGKTLGRAHVARALVARGEAPTIEQAFQRWLADGRPACVEHQPFLAEDAVNLIRKAGGVPTLAHPGVSRVPPEEIRALRMLGVEGLEARHPLHSQSDVERFTSVAIDLDMVVTAGSDFHGEKMDPRRRLGDARMHLSELGRLEERRIETAWS